MNIAVVDEGNNLVAFQRMDGAWLGSINISMNKAYTARAFDMETKTLAPCASRGSRSMASTPATTDASSFFPGAFPSKTATPSSAPSG